MGLGSSPDQGLGLGLGLGLASGLDPGLEPGQGWDLGPGREFPKSVITQISGL